MEMIEMGPFSILPTEIFVRIANMLDIDDQLSLASANQSIHAIVKQYCLQRYSRRVTAKKLSHVRDSMHTLKALRNDPSGEHNERCYSVWTLCLIFCTLIAVPTLFTYFFYSELVGIRQKAIYSMLYNVSCILLYNDVKSNCSSEINESKFGQICQIGTFEDFVPIFPITTTATSGWLSFGVFGITVSTYFLHTIFLFWLFYPTVNRWLENRFRQSHLWKSYQNLQLELQKLDGRNNYAEENSDIANFRSSFFMIVISFFATYVLPFIFSYLCLSHGLYKSYVNSLDPTKGNFGFQTDSYRCLNDIYFSNDSNITELAGAKDYITSQHLPVRGDKLALFGSLSSVGMLLVCIIPFCYILLWVRSYKSRLAALSWKTLEMT